jgi:hypothetical protein
MALPSSSYAEAEGILTRRIAARTPDLMSSLFGMQRRFVESDAVFTDATCSRRAGKTHGAATKLIKGYMKRGGRAPSLYFTLTRGTAKRNIWPTLLELNRRHNLGFEPNEADLVLKKAGQGAIYLAGIDNRSEIDKLRGTGWGEVVGDEAQAFPAYFKELVEDVLVPSFMDHKGHLSLIGTPGPVPVGYFHEITQSDEWEHFRWTCFDNSHVDAAGLLATTLKMRGVEESDPSIQREFFGRWAWDANSLVFRYDPTRNAYANRPEAQSWSYVIGVDLGFDDADAISVLAWSESSPDIYLVDEWVGTKQSITDLGLRLAAFKAKYDPLDIVADTGGLGKKIADEISQRTGIPISAAEKERKLEHIELLNDALRSGRFYAKADSRFAQDAMLVEWDRTNPEKPKISDRFHSDICDSVLYAYRRAQHWLYEPKAEVPEVGSNAWMNATEREMLEAAEAAVREQKAYRQELDDQMGWI